MPPGRQYAPAMRTIITFALALLSGLTATLAADPALPPHTRSEDVIYGRKYGTALTLDVFAPQGQANGAGVVFVVSGGWFSAHEAINPAWFPELLKRGYTVFTVVHGSQPRFTLPEVIEDMHRSVRFIRHNAGRYKIDPNRLGITGGSAGGHLSLLIGTSGREGNPKAKDPVDQESSRVGAVACFFPPTDFLNYGREGRDVFVALKEELGPFKAPFDFLRLDEKDRRFVLIEDPAERLDIARKVSPITHVSPDDPPMLILHGDADKLVPIQQAEIMRDALTKAGVPAEIVVRPGEGHGWKTLLGDMTIIADWFDRYLPAATGSRPAGAEEATAKTEAPQAQRQADFRNFSGWGSYLSDHAVGMRDVWSLRDGVLICRGEPMGYLYTKQGYRDFRLRVEYRWAAKPGNSGILMRINGKPQALPRCLEMQLEHGNAGDLYGFFGMKLSGDQARFKQVQGHAICGDLSGVSKREDAEKPAGEWNTAEVLVEGPSTKAWLNGKLINEATDAEQTTGPIALQSEGGEIHFRNLTITPLGAGSEK